MNHIKSLFIAFIIFNINAFCMGIEPSKAMQEFDPIYWTNIDGLFSNAKLYDGKKIAVYGFYVKEAPTSELHNDDPKRDTDYKWYGKILWVDPINRKNGSWCVIVGRFSNKPSGTFDRYFGALESIEYSFLIDK
jgi:hypothetical protein